MEQIASYEGHRNKKELVLQRKGQPFCLGCKFHTDLNLESSKLNTLESPIKQLRSPWQRTRVDSWPHCLHALMEAWKGHLYKIPDRRPF